MDFTGRLMRGLSLSGRFSTFSDRMNRSKYEIEDIPSRGDLMKTLSSLCILFTICALSFFSACDTTTNPGESPADPELANQKVAEANKLLIPKIIILANSGDTTGLDVSAAATLYAEALQADPGNGDAHFGLAITDLISIVPDLASVAGGMSPLTPSIVMSMLSGGTSTSSFFEDMGAHLRSRVSGFARQQVEAAMGRGKPAPVPGGTAGAGSVQELPSFYQDLIENLVLPKITSAAGHLTVLTNITGYAFLITPAMTDSITTDTYRIDHTEIYLLLALLQGITAEASVLVAYNVDYDPSNAAAVSQAWEVSSPFLAFRPNGATRMQGARTNFVGMASSIQGSLNHLMNEPPNPEVDLINYNPNDAAAFQEAIMILDTVKTALSGPYAIPDGPTVNLKEFFDNAIPNYKAKVPPYTVTVAASSSPGLYDAVLTWTAASFDEWIFPDPTLNGFLPGMTDAGLKLLFGITAADWERSVLIEG